MRVAATMPGAVQPVLHAPGHSLDTATRNFFEPRFRHNFANVRVHTDEAASRSARALGALAYTIGNHVVFAHGHFAPASLAGRTLLAHELTHTLQQRALTQSSERGGQASMSSSADERNADATATAVMANRALPSLVPAMSRVQRQADPHISKVTVHLSPPESADLEWQGTPPAGAPGGDHFIALHQHDEVNGRPVGHGCVRMDEDNAKRIHDYSRGRHTNVTIDGRAAPVDCDDSRKCGASSALPAAAHASNEPHVVPGREGMMS
jgi:hypothetical protein